MNTANYPIVVGDVLNAGTEAFKVTKLYADAVYVDNVQDGETYFLPLSIVQAIGTVDPKTGTPRV